LEEKFCKNKNSVKIKLKQVTGGLDNRKVVVQVQAGQRRFTVSHSVQTDSTAEFFEKLTVFQQIKKCHTS
jgi:hypothetical protein